MDSQLRLDILRELLSCVDNLCAWRYDKEMILQSSNSKQAEFFDILFSVSLCKQQALAHCTQNDTPILLTSTIGLTWIAAPEYEADELCHVYVIGPVFTANASERSILQMAQDMDISVSLRTSFLEQIKTVPIVMIPAFCRYGAMLHFCITGQKINAYDLLQAKSAGRVRRSGEPQPEKHGIWMTEQLLLRMVEEGNLNYQTVLQEQQVHGKVGTLAENSLRQSKNEIIVWIALCTRAAIRGGLEVETAFNFSDYYIQCVEGCQTVAEAYRYSSEMYDTFVHKVNRCKNLNYSQAVMACIDYVQFHVQEKIDLDVMAQHLGYTGYYLTNKFKKETGKSLNNFISEQKVERAKLLLTSTGKSLTDISDELNFTSLSYFGAVFKKLTGMSPSAYRLSKG